MKLWNLGHLQVCVTEYSIVLAERDSFLYIVPAFLKTSGNISVFMHLKPPLSFSLYIPYWCVSQRMLAQIIVGLDTFFCCVWIRKAAELFWVQSQTKSDFCLFQTISAPNRTDECCWIFSEQTPSCRSTEHIFLVINASVISVLCHRRLWSVRSLWTSTCPVPRHRPWLPSPPAPPRRSLGSESD